MPPTNLNALRVFATVAQHGNIQRAAEVLNLSRGAVSQRIKQLEQGLGTPLLVRGARGVSLTPAGERCRAAMDEALRIIDTALVDTAGPRPDVRRDRRRLKASERLTRRRVAVAAGLPSDPAQ